MKTLSTILILLTLSSCYSYKNSIGNYNLPTTDIKDSTKVGKVCDDEDNHPFDIDVDLTVETARKRAKITSITAIEKESSGNLFHWRNCIIVRGN